MTSSRWPSVWIAVSGVILALGGIAWLSKLAVIVATDGRVAYTGAAAAFFTLGLVSMLFGSTGVGLRLVKHQDNGLRVSIALLSPVAFLVGFGFVQGIAVGLYDLAGWAFGDLGPEYVREEAAILLTAVVSLALGVALLVGVVRGARHDFARSRTRRTNVARR